MASIMVRADITDEQWKEIRKRAIDLGVPIQRHLGNLIAADLESNATAASPAESATVASTTGG